MPHALCAMLINVADRQGAITALVGFASGIVVFVGEIKNAGGRCDRFSFGIL